MRTSARSASSLDFTSALYLGMDHSSVALRPWRSFTTGSPAALASPPEAQYLAQQLAQLQGCEHAVLGASTLHLFWDLFGILSRQPVKIYFDSGLYPIARWGIERAAANGVPVRRFPHHNADTLQRMLLHDRSDSLIPLVVTDGFCPDCGKTAPLAVYLQAAQRFDGQLIVDDTQSLGIFGHSPSRDAPYGRGGGGMLRRTHLEGANVLAICSLAKAFGSPLAVLSGSRKEVENFKAKSETRVHCSPPSVASLRAAEHALALNDECGDRLRARLAALVFSFRRSAGIYGFRFTGGLFPVQTLQLGSEIESIRVHQRLSRAGIRTVLRNAGRICFVLTARHTPDAIDRAVTALRDACPIRSLPPQNTLTAANFLRGPEA